MTIIVQQPKDSNGNPQPMVYDSDTGKIIVDSNGYVINGGKRLVNLPTKADYVNTPKTQTAGIYEASNYAAGGFNQGGIGKVILQPGTYDVYTLIYIWDNVTLDGQGSTINYYGTETDQYTTYSPSEVFIVAANQGYYFGSIKNLTINIQSTATQLTQVLSGVTALHTVVYDNIIVNCNSIAPIGLKVNTTSNAIYKDIYIDKPTTAGVVHGGDNGMTGNVFDNVSINSGTQGNTVNGYNIEAADGALFIIGGRIRGGNYGVYFNSTNYIIYGVYIIHVELDAVSSSFGFNQVTNSMSKIGFFDVISTDPSGRHFGLIAGSPTGLFRSGGIYVGASTTDNIGFTNTDTTPTISANPPVSSTVYQNPNPYNIRLKIPVTYNPSTSAAATLATGISSTSTVTTSTKVSLPSGLTAADGQILTYDMVVPAGWYYELVVTNATIGTVEVEAV